jgi:hypothetical protein
MSLHDDYARVTPFELAFPDPGSVRALSEALSAMGADVSSPGAFLSLPPVAAFVQQLAGRDAPTEALHHYAMLAFHAVHFLAAGEPLYLLGAATARDLVERAPDGEAIPPVPAGYLQLPQHLFWVEGSETGAPESLDGLFWTDSGTGDLHVLAVVGVRPDRGGFGTMALPEAPLADAQIWMAAHVRKPGEDFASSLPGGDLDRLYAVETAGELLKLVARFFGYAAERPDALVKTAPAPGEDALPRPSELPYTLVRAAA